MKKLFLAIILFVEPFFLFSQTFTTENVIVQKGQSIKVKRYTSGNGYGYSGDDLGGCVGLGSVSGEYVTLYGLERGFGKLHTWSGSTNKYYSVKVVDVVRIDIPGNLDLAVDESYTYSPIVTDLEVTTTLSWSSSDPFVATISADGKVTAVGVGKTTITCSATNGILSKSIVSVKPVLAEKLSLYQQSVELSTGEIFQFTPVVQPSNVTNKSIKWISSNENIAQVDDNGCVTAIAHGYCSIYCIADDGSGKSDKCLIHVAGTDPLKGDINGDGIVSPMDASLILQYIAKKITW